MAGTCSHCHEYREGLHYDIEQGHICSDCILEVIDNTLERKAERQLS